MDTKIEVHPKSEDHLLERGQGPSVLTEPMRPLPLNIVEHSSLTEAAARGNIPELKRLLPLSEINWQGVFRNTALFWAIANAKTKAAMFLIENAKGVDYNIQDYCGKTALHLAIMKGWQHVNVQPESDDKTPLNEVIKALIKKTDLSKQDHSGNTPLHYAFMRRDIDAIALLLKQGASLDILNRRGLTPIKMLSLSREEVFRSLNAHVSYFTILETVEWDESTSALKEKFEWSFKKARQVITTKIKSIEDKPLEVTQYTRFNHALMLVENKTQSDFRSHHLTEHDKSILEFAAWKLAVKVADKTVKEKDVLDFAKTTAPYKRTPLWCNILGAMIGAAVGILIGVMVGTLSGPLAALLLLHAGVTGAIAGASVGGFLLGTIGFLGVKKGLNARHPLTRLECEARKQLIA